MAPPIPIPVEVRSWLSGVFGSCNAQVANLITDVPTTQETALDMAFIQSFSHVSAPYRFPSGWTVELSTRYLGGGRHWSAWPDQPPRWEIADIGLLVMYRQDGDWIVGSVLEGKSGAKFSWGWSLFPPAPGAMRPNEISLYSGGTLGIPTGATNKPLAEKYLEVVGSPRGQLCDIEVGNIPALVTLPPKDLKALPAVVQQMLQFAKQNGDQTGWTSGLAGTVGAAFTDPLVQELLAGSLTPAQVASKVYANLLKNKAGKA